MMKNKKLVLVFVMVILLLVTMVGVVKASNDLDIEIVNQQNTATNNTDNNTAGGNNTVNEANNNVVPNTNNTVGNNTTLPQTGVEDNTILFVAFATIFAVSAVYAYKKIRDYKNI